MTKITARKERRTKDVTRYQLYVLAEHLSLPETDAFRSTPHTARPRVSAVGANDHVITGRR